MAKKKAFKKETAVITEPSPFNSIANTLVADSLDRNRTTLAPYTLAETLVERAAEKGELDSSNIAACEQAASEVLYTTMVCAGRHENYTFGMMPSDERAEVMHTAGLALQCAPKGNKIFSVWVTMLQKAYPVGINRERDKYLNELLADMDENMLPAEAEALQIRIESVSAYLDDYKNGMPAGYKPMTNVENYLSGIVRRPVVAEAKEMKTEIDRVYAENRLALEENYFNNQFSQKPALPSNRLA